MRKRREQLEGEARLVEMTNPVASGEVQSTDMIDDSAELIDESPNVAAKPRVQMPEVTPEQAAAMGPKRFRVTKSGRILYRGYVTMMREGKVVDSGNYDIARLQEQGIALEPLN